MLSIGIKKNSTLPKCKMFWGKKTTKNNSSQCKPIDMLASLHVSKLLVWLCVAPSIHCWTSGSWTDRNQLFKETHRWISFHISSTSSPRTVFYNSVQSHCPSPGRTPQSALRVVDTLHKTQDLMWELGISSLKRKHIRESITWDSWKITTSTETPQTARDNFSICR